MRAFFAIVVVSILALGSIVALVQATSAPADIARVGSQCSRGHVRAFALVSGERLGGVGAIPSAFDGAGRLFTRRYSCLGRPAQVRRVDLGTYQVLFPGTRATAATVSAYNAEGTSASVESLGTGIFQVVLAGPQMNTDQLVRRDVPFVIVVH